MRPVISDSRFVARKGINCERRSIITKKKKYNFHFSHSPQSSRYASFV